MVEEKSEDKNSIDIKIAVRKGLLIDNIVVGDPPTYDLTLVIAKLESLKLPFLKLFEQTTKRLDWEK